MTQKGWLIFFFIIVMQFNTIVKEVANVERYSARMGDGG